MEKGALHYVTIMFKLFSGNFSKIGYNLLAFIINNEREDCNEIKARKI